jgi:squalene synthase HpnC
MSGGNGRKTGGEPVIMEEAYEYCRKLTKSHYENFPVASLFIPKSKRKYFYAAYAFMRTADDFADNEAIDINQRLQLLVQWQANLEACYRGKAKDEIFVALQDTVEQCRIPKEYFDNLLNAFKVDLFKNRYGNFNELLEYCNYSANPVGRIVLSILEYDSHAEKDVLFSCSDSICTALQLANHWQDVFVDRKKQRCYVPQEDMQRFGYGMKDWELESVNERFRELMRFEVQRAREMFEKGRPLLAYLNSPEKYEIALVWLGGMRILEKLDKNKYDVLNRRPTVGFLDTIVILFRLLTFRYRA